LAWADPTGHQPECHTCDFEDDVIEGSPLSEVHTGCQSCTFGLPELKPPAIDLLDPSAPPGPKPGSPSGSGNTVDLPPITEDQLAQYGRAGMFSDSQCHACHRLAPGEPIRETTRAEKIAVGLLPVGLLGIGAAPAVGGTAVGAAGSATISWGSIGIQGGGAGTLSLAPATVTVHRTVVVAVAGAVAAIAGALTSAMTAGPGGGNTPPEGAPASTRVPDSAKREFFDLDEAASAAAGEKATVIGRLGDIGPVKNEGVISDLQSSGYDPNEFRAIQYEISTASGRYYTITVFEAEGGVYFGPHLSHINW
jgi:hypothetical protein